MLGRNSGHCDALQAPVPGEGLRSDLVALCFDLVHGLGFSGGWARTASLAASWSGAGGVQPGGGARPAHGGGVSLLLARGSGYRTVVVKGGSVALIVWTVQRVAFSG